VQDGEYVSTAACQKLEDVLMETRSRMLKGLLADGDEAGLDRVVEGISQL
jgi:hypothetical protein